MRVMRHFASYCIADFLPSWLGCIYIFRLFEFRREIDFLYLAACLRRVVPRPEIVFIFTFRDQLSIDKSPLIYRGKIWHTRLWVQRRESQIFLDYVFCQLKARPSLSVAVYPAYSMRGCCGGEEFRYARPVLAPPPSIFNVRTIRLGLGWLHICPLLFGIWP